MSRENLGLSIDECLAGEGAPEGAQARSFKEVVHRPPLAAPCRLPVKLRSLSRHPTQPWTRGPEGI